MRSFAIFKNAARLKEPKKRPEGVHLCVNAKILELTSGLEQLKNPLT